MDRIEIDIHMIKTYENVNEGLQRCIDKMNGDPICGVLAGYIEINNMLIKNYKSDLNAPLWDSNPNPKIPLAEIPHLYFAY